MCRASLASLARNTDARPLRFVAVASLRSELWNFTIEAATAHTSAAAPKETTTMRLENPPFKPSDLADALALVTNEAWTARKDLAEETLHDDTDSYRLFAENDGAELYITIRERDKRIHVGGSMHYYPRGRGQNSVYLTHYVSNYNYKPDHDISCGITRGPLAIAKDIARRLLPDYRRDRNKGIEKVTQRLAEQDNAFAAAERYMGMINGKTSQRGSIDSRESHIYFNQKPVSFDGTVHANGAISFHNLSIGDRELMQEFMQLIARYTHPTKPAQNTITHSAYSAFCSAKRKGRTDDEAWYEAFSAATEFFAGLFPQGEELDERTKTAMIDEGETQANQAQRIYMANDLPKAA